MEIILKTDIAGLGYKNDVVKVKDGYARNYLIPKGYAIIANASNLKQLQEELKQAAHKAAKLKADAELLAERMGNLTLELKAKSGENGRLFGSITTGDLAKALQEKGFQIDRKKILIQGEVKTLGEYQAILDLHREVKHSITFRVISE